jgi:hypothetical protein
VPKKIAKISRHARAEQGHRVKIDFPDEKKRINGGANLLSASRGLLKMEKEQAGLTLSEK